MPSEMPTGSVRAAAIAPPESSFVKVARVMGVPSIAELRPIRCSAWKNTVRLAAHYNAHTMATYQIWADITKIADDRYFVTVSAVPKDERTQERTGGVKTAEA